MLCISVKLSILANALEFTVKTNLGCGEEPLFPSACKAACSDKSLVWTLEGIPHIFFLHSNIDCFFFGAPE